MGKWFRVQSVSSAIGRSMVLILFMASLIAVVAMVTLFYSVPDAKAINLSGSLRMQAYRMAYEIEKDQVVLGRLAQFEQTLHAPELQETQRWITPASLRRTYGAVSYTHLDVYKRQPLQGEVHVLEVVAVAALARIRLLHPLPLPLGHLPPVGFKLLAGIHLAGDHAPQLLGGLHLADDLVGPFVGYVAIRAAGPHAGAVGVVDGVAVLHEHVVLHLVATGAEGLGVGRFHGGVEPAPEDDATEEAHQQDDPEGRLRR